MGKASYLKINASISYLAYVKLTVDGTEVDKPWCLVRDNKQFVCLEPLFERNRENCSIRPNYY